MQREWVVVLVLQQMAILELLVQITDDEQMVMSLHAKVQSLWLDNDKNTNQECLQTYTMSTPLIALSLFRATMLKY